MGTLVLFGRTFLALGLVLALVWGLSRLMRRGQNGGPRRRTRTTRPSRGYVDVLSRKSLSRTTAVVLVRVGGRSFVIGTTPQSVTLISEISTSELDLTSEPRETELPRTAVSDQSPWAWDAAISKLRDLSVRR